MPPDSEHDKSLSHRQCHGVKDTCPLMPLCLLDIPQSREDPYQGTNSMELSMEVPQETNRSRPFCSWESLPACLAPGPCPFAHHHHHHQWTLGGWSTLLDTGPVNCSQVVLPAALFCFSVKSSTHSLQSSLLANSSLLPCRELPQALELFIPYSSSWRISIKYPLMWSYHGLNEIVSLTYLFPSPFPCIMSISFYVKWVSCGQHMVGWWLLIFSAVIMF